MQTLELKWIRENDYDNYPDWIATDAEGNRFSYNNSNNNRESFYRVLTADGKAAWGPTAAEALRRAKLLKFPDSGLEYYSDEFIVEIARTAPRAPRWYDFEASAKFDLMQELKSAHREDKVTHFIVVYTGSIGRLSIWDAAEI